MIRSQTPEQDKNNRWHFKDTSYFDFVSYLPIPEEAEYHGRVGMASEKNREQA